jgi:carbon-monoxide dehydrogenase medium subunit
VIPAPFEYHKPQSVAEAIGLLARHGDDARVVAGGHSLVPMMKLRLATPGHLVDLQGLAELRGMEVGADVIRIGALATQHEVIESAPLAETCPILRETALQIADPQVRYCGTLGGNVANGDPGNDMPAVMMALDAVYHLQGSGGRRTVAARGFYEGAFFTALGEDEILTGVEVARPAAGHGYAYTKQKRKVGDYATAAAAVMLTMQDGRCSAAAIALTNVADTPVFAEEASAALVETGVDGPAVDAAVERARAATAPAEDGRGPAEFRTHVAGVMVRRAIEQALLRAGGR